MARYKPTGAACSNTRPCNVRYSDIHNERRSNDSCVNNNPNTSIRPELTKSNTFWKADDVPSLPELDKKIREDYASVERFSMRRHKVVDEETGAVTFEKCRVKRKCTMPSTGKTAGHPLKESILLLPSNDQATDEMVKAFVRRVEEMTGWRCVRWYVHRDERYEDPIFPERNHINNHAHIVWDTYDYGNHEIRNEKGKVKSEDGDKKGAKTIYARMQDIASEVTGMKRGEPSNARHLTVVEFKNREEAERIKELAEISQDLKIGIICKRIVNITELKKIAIYEVLTFNHLVEVEKPTENEYAVKNRLESRIKEPLKKDEAGMNDQAISLYEDIVNLAKIIRNLTQRIISQAEKAKEMLQQALTRKAFLRLFVSKQDIENAKTVDMALAEKAEIIKQRDKALKECEIIKKENECANRKINDMARDVAAWLPLGSLEKLRDKANWKSKLGDSVWYEVIERATANHPFTGRYYDYDYTESEQITRKSGFHM